MGVGGITEDLDPIASAKQCAGKEFSRIHITVFGTREKGQGKIMKFSVNTHHSLSRTF